MKRLGQVLLVLGMAALAALLRLSGPGMARRRLGWLPWCVAVLSFVLTVPAYRFLDALWSPVFPAAACVATWAALGLLDRRWSDGKR